MSEDRASRPKYPIKWKRTNGNDCEIQLMNDFHLTSAYKRVLRAKKDFADGLSLDPVQQEDALEHLLAEMTRRGLDPRYKGGRPPEGTPPPQGDDDLPEME